MNSKKMSICMVTIDHSPIDNRIFYKEGLSLKKAGYEVTIICSKDEDGFVRDMGKKKILNPQKNNVFEIEGIKIISIDRPKGIFQKMLNKIFLSNYLNSFIQEGIAVQADVYHAHEPVSYYLALQIGKKNGAKVIFDSHEMWDFGPEKDNFVRYLHLNKLKFLITANQITRGFILAKNSTVQTEVIYNYPEKEIFKPVFSESKFDHPIIVHEGYIPFNRGLKEIIEAIRLLKNDFPNVKFRILGETRGAEKEYLLEKIKEYGLEKNIEETGWVDYQQVGNKLKDCAIGLIVKTGEKDNILSGPSIKLFSYMAYGLAIVDVDLPESTRFLNKMSNGITIRKRSVENLYKAIRTLMQDKNLLMKYCKNSFDSYNKYNWDSEEKKLLDFYKNVVLNDNEIYLR